MAECDVAVVGLGYVGLPLVREATLAGLRVCGLEKSAERLRSLRAGSSYMNDVSDAELAAALASGRFTPTADEECLAAARTIVICVPTPLRDSIPDLTAVLTAGAAVGRRMRPGTLVALVATRCAGTTEEVLQPLLEQPGRRAGQDFHLAFSPERIDPGNARFGLRNTPKLVGGVTPACAAAARDFYARLVDQVVTVSSPKIAEMAK